MFSKSKKIIAGFLLPSNMCTSCIFADDKKMQKSSRQLSPLHKKCILKTHPVHIFTPALIFNNGKDYLISFVKINSFSAYLFTIWIESSILFNAFLFKI